MDKLFNIHCPICFSHADVSLEDALEEVSKICRCGGIMKVDNRELIIHLLERIEKLESKNE